MVTIAVSDEPASDPHDDARYDANETAMERALNGPARMFYQRLPLREIIKDLKERYGVEIQIDRKALDEAGISLDAPISKRLRGVSLQTALDHLLHDLGLAYSVQGEVILITSVDAARQTKTTKVDTEPAVGVFVPLVEMHKG